MLGFRAIVAIVLCASRERAREIHYFGDGSGKTTPPRVPLVVITKLQTSMHSIRDQNECFKAVLLDESKVGCVLEGQ